MFLLSTCQIGAESALKNEIARSFPTLRPAFARPGFLTLKITDEEAEPFERLRELRPRSVFARFLGVSIGKVLAESPEAAASRIWRCVADSPLLEEKKIRRIHCFSRDARPVGEQGFEPVLTERNRTVFERLFATRPDSVRLAPEAKHLESPAAIGETVLDCIEVEPQEYWIGFHETERGESRLPGGLFLADIPNDTVSRAALKFEEALRWSGFPVCCGSRCVDIGCAPGGASQVLLARGAEVLGVDPAEINPRIEEHPGFTFLRGRIGQLKKRLFRKVKYAICDMNVAPGFTLDALEELVRHRESDIRGAIFTLKLFQWKLAEEIPAYLERIRGWGLDEIRVRQLAFNRQEITVAAKTAR